MNEMFKTRDVEKLYWAIVEGKVEQKFERLEHYLRKNKKNNLVTVFTQPTKDAKKAIWEYKVLGELDYYTLLEVDLYTGRSLQIRSQLSFIGNPIKGELKYGSKRSNRDGSISLHARKISFTHPVSKEIGGNAGNRLHTGQGQGGDHFRSTHGQGSGLVERDHANAAGHLQVLAAFDQYPFARTAANTGNDRDGRGDHQSTGTGDNQQGQRQHRVLGEQVGYCRHDDDRRRVPTGEAFDETLRRRLGFLRFFDTMNDVRQSGVRAHLLGADGHVTVVASGASEYLIALFFTGRHWLTVDGALVDRGASAQYCAIDRDAPTGPDHYGLSGRDVHRVHSHFLAIAQYGDFGWRQR